MNYPLSEVHKRICIAWRERHQFMLQMWSSFVSATKLTWKLSHFDIRREKSGFWNAWTTELRLWPLFSAVSNPTIGKKIVGSSTYTVWGWNLSEECDFGGDWCQNTTSQTKHEATWQNITTVLHQTGYILCSKWTSLKMMPKEALSEWITNCEKEVLPECWLGWRPQLMLLWLGKSTQLEHEFDLTR